MKKLAYLAYPAIVVLSLVGAVGAQAAPGLGLGHAPGSGFEANPPHKMVEVKSWTQVRAELTQARADGSMAFYAEGNPHVATPVSVLTRAEVRAETVAARAAGYDAIYREGGVAGVTLRPLRAFSTGRTLAAAPAGAGAGQ
jgi:hypothetical protein